MIFLEAMYIINVHNHTYIHALGGTTLLRAIFFATHCIATKGEAKA